MREYVKKYTELTMKMIKRHRYSLINGSLRSGPYPSSLATVQSYVIQCMTTQTILLSIRLLLLYVVPQLSDVLQKQNWITFF